MMLALTQASLSLATEATIMLLSKTTEDDSFIPALQRPLKKFIIVCPLRWE